MNPYLTYPERAFWRRAVADVNMLEMKDLWRPKFTIPKDVEVVTAGSCFAQHISRAMVSGGYKWLDAEPAPAFLPDDIKRKYGYGVFSFRTGNIYTTAALRQWVEAAFGEKRIPGEYWESEGRIYDPLRPAIEPGGFASVTEFEAHRRITLAAIRTALSEAGLFIFTLGLTESWRNSHTDLVYAACPGTLAGEFSEEQHKFHNLAHSEILGDLQSTFDLIKKHNPNIKFLLTVSPVPLTATASGNHVLVSTVFSKSVLRSVAGETSLARDDTEYFPSFEIISSFTFRGSFYMPNIREVSNAGVAHVMEHFFAGLGSGPMEPPRRRLADAPQPLADAKPGPSDVICEEALLEAFAI